MKGKDKGLVEDLMILGERMRQISEKRIIKYPGCISNKDMQLYCCPDKNMHCIYKDFERFKEYTYPPFLMREFP